jgi:hypothetical protein
LATILGNLSPTISITPGVRATVADHRARTYNIRVMPGMNR